MFSRIFIRLPLHREGAAQLKRHYSYCCHPLEAVRLGQPLARWSPSKRFGFKQKGVRVRESPEEKLPIDESSYPFRS